MSFSGSFIQLVYSKVKELFLFGELKCEEKISYKNMAIVNSKHYINSDITTE